MVGTSLRSFAHPTTSAGTLADLILRSIATRCVSKDEATGGEALGLPRLTPPVFFGGTAHRFGQRPALLLWLFRRG